MPKPYSLDLRERVFRYVDEGHSCRAAAAHFQVSVSFVVNLARAFRVRGSLAPNQWGAPPRQARTASHFSLGEARREGRHHHAGASGRTGRRHLREGRSRLAFALAHPHWLSLQKRMARPVCKGVFQDRQLISLRRTACPSPALAVDESAGLSRAGRCVRRSRQIGPADPLLRKAR